MSSLTRQKLETRVFDAAQTLVDALDDLRAYSDATRLVWHSVDSAEFGNRLSESMIEKLVGDSDAVLRDLSIRCEDLRTALRKSGMASDRS